MDEKKESEQTHSSKVKMISNRSDSDSRVQKQQARFHVHPLVMYDPEAVNGGIEVLKLEYFEVEIPTIH